MLRNISIARIGISLAAAALTVAAVGCIGGTSADEPGVENSNAAVSCDGTVWQQGAFYPTGTVVSFNGQNYIAEHDNPGYDPTISTWFWDPYTGCSGGGTTSGGGSSCNNPAWAQGTFYPTGSIVSFNGQNYIAEHENPGYDPTISTWFWDPYTGGCGGGGDDPPPPPPLPGGGGFGSIISEAQFNSMFPNRNGFYTYQALASAAATFNGFATTGDSDTQKREVAAFLANVAHETGNLVYIEEIAKATYCGDWGPPGCSCAPGKQYFGRGPIQLSWNGNYCAAGNALGVDLKNDPDLVARDATIAWRTGLWFWNTQSGAGSMTPHAGIVGGSFGQTIRSINGALECNGGRPEQVQSRIASYTRFTGILGVSPGNDLGC